MRCYICDVVIDTPQFNADHDDYDPCETCKQVIADTVGPYANAETPFSSGGPFDESYTFDDAPATDLVDLEPKEFE